MKTSFCKTLLFPFFLFFFLVAGAQTDTLQKEKTTFKISLNYNNNLNYYGRTDSLQSSGFFPLAELWLNEAIYINAAPIFVNNAVQKMDYAGTVATLGYQHLSDKWFTHLFLLKPFYTQSSSLVQATLKAQSGVSVSYLTKIVNLTAGADARWSDAIDWGATAGIDHTLRVPTKSGGIWVVNPSVCAYWGTQHFSQTYTLRKGGSLLSRGRQETVTSQHQRFKVLAFEASVPVIFVQGAWQFSITPAYVLPQNLLQVPGQPQLSEQGRPTLWATVGAKFAF